MCQPSPQEIAAAVAERTAAAGFTTVAEWADAGLFCRLRAADPTGASPGFRVDVSCLPGQVSVEAFPVGGGWRRVAGGSGYAYNMTAQLARALDDVEGYARRLAVEAGRLPAAEAATTGALRAFACDAAETPLDAAEARARPALLPADSPAARAIALEGRALLAGAPDRAALLGFACWVATAEAEGRVARALVLRAAALAPAPEAAAPAARILAHAA